ncbi:Choline-sulfatase [Planctomycetes bacterium Poly30]|uniref:Choline-sulfatase n=2 Tax=Saltatorellus ferox TaxID=2528018 RepID=A0A518F034_9BACT|nr:Choline-sulfatase [Planctomycetes bacterium Poly30]
MSLYGHFRETTPHLDELARTGTVIEHASAMSSWTLASMSMLITGEIKARADVAVLTTHKHVAEGFSEAGFHTGAIVANPVLDKKLHYHRGFDHFDVQLTSYIEEPASPVIGRGIDWIDSVLSDGRPFFLWLHPVDPHYPFDPDGGARFPEAPEEGARLGAASSLRWGRETFPSPMAPIPEPTALDGEAWARISASRNLYDSEILQFDAAMGELIAALKERKLFENTVIAVTSDHGEGLWERLALPDSPDKDPNVFFPSLYRRHGLMLHEEQTRVPLLFHGPGVPAGVRRPQWVQHVDVVPTLYALANVPLPKPLPGKALFEEEGSDPRGPLISVCSRSFSVTVDERWRAHFPRQHRLRKMDIPVELYDLQADPGERVVVDDPERVEAMEEMLEAWRHRYSPNDPDQPLDREIWAKLQALGYGGEIEFDTQLKPKPQPAPKTQTDR